MSSSKTIVVLANSWKLGGRCVAGKEIEGKQQWIRPVSDRPNGELTTQMRCFTDSAIPNVLDVVSIPLAKHVPHLGYQSENYLVDDSRQWTRIGRFKSGDLIDLTDEPLVLWENGHSSGQGSNDRIPEKSAKDRIRTSLCLILARQLSLDASVNPFSGKHQVRACFQYKDNYYNLKVTDPITAQKYQAAGAGCYQMEGDSVICVSIGEPFEGYCYKLAAAIISSKDDDEQ